MNIILMKFFIDAMTCIALALLVIGIITEIVRMRILRLIRRLFDAKAEFEAEQVIAPDEAIILQWKAGVRRRTGVTRKERANVANLRIERAKRARA